MLICTPLPAATLSGRAARAVPEAPCVSPAGVEVTVLEETVSLEAISGNAVKSKISRRTSFGPLTIVSAGKVAPALRGRRTTRRMVVSASRTANGHDRGRKGVAAG